MISSTSFRVLSENRLLARLFVPEYNRLLPKLQLITLDYKQVLSQPGRPLDFVYFPLKGLISSIIVLQDGTSIEVATLGREGMVGVPAFLGNPTSPYRLVVQVPGKAMRMDVSALYAETRIDCPLYRLLSLYAQAYLYQVSQVAACNGLHSVKQRCCRWLLMTHDRGSASQFPITHEFLAELLGVRRSSVSDIVGPLQDVGLLQYHRGKMRILNRNALESLACECYRTLNEDYQELFD